MPLGLGHVLAVAPDPHVIGAHDNGLELLLLDGLRQQVRGQMGYPHPGQDQKALLVGQGSQALLALRHRPTDEPIPHGDFPGRRAKDHHRQLPPPHIRGQVSYVLPNRAIETAIRVLGEQLPDAPP
jgi:hypothetical protein